MPLFSTFRWIALKFSLKLKNYGWSAYIFLKVVHSTGRVCDKCFDPLITCVWPRILATDTASLKRSKLLSGNQPCQQLLSWEAQIRKREKDNACWEQWDLTWAGKKGNSQAAKAETKGRCMSWQALNTGEYNWKLTQLQWKRGLRN